MSVDTHGLNQEHVGKRMCVELADGESLEILLQELTVCASPALLRDYIHPDFHQSSGWNEKQGHSVLDGDWRN
jgi:hypothetical protein